MTRRGRHVRWIVVVACGLSWPVLAACRPSEGGTVEPLVLPPAAAYDTPPDFAGEWVGEVASTTGVLKIDKLAPARYYGIYQVDGADLRYVLSLEQTMVDDGGEQVPANRCTFTWQDGTGGRGTGWLLINREDSALTGEFGEGAGTWTFIRIE